MTDITSPSNERIKALVRLWERKERMATGTFLIEGLRELTRAMEAGVDLVEVYLCPDLGAHGMADDVPVTTVSPDAFAKVSRRQNPDGILGVARQWPTSLSAIGLSARPLVLIVEAIEKPGNLGAMLRTADAAGMDAVVLCDPMVDIFNPNVIRASQGSVFTVATAAATVDEVLVWIDESGLAVVATFPDAAKLYTDADLSGPTTIVVGAEATGLTDRWRRVGTAVSLPMAGSADSLNAATTAAVVAYEAVRQRGR